MGSGPAGEVTYADIRDRIARAVQRYADARDHARLLAEHTAAELAKRGNDGDHTE
jgi:hypothetical protein